MLEIKIAGVEDVEIVTDMVLQLLTELTGNTFEKKHYLHVAKELLASSQGYTVFLAIDKVDKCAGIVSVMECCSIYAGGRFGIIQEFYVLPDYRSFKIGQQLIKSVKEHAKQNKWGRLEVGAPDATRWKRTIDFYRREGFKQIGPRLNFKF